MKIISLLLSCGTLVGCNTYPKNYTYNPTVTVSGNNVNVALPGPFAKTSPTITSNVTNNSHYNDYRAQPSPLTARIPRPPVSAQYYYQQDEADTETTDELLASIHSCPNPIDFSVGGLSELVPY